MYYKEKQKGKRDKVCSYVEKDGEIYEVMWSSRKRKLFEGEWLQELKDILAEVMLLKMKAGGKELDPKFLNAEEQEKFRQADAAEWKQWIGNGVIRRLRPDEARRVPKDSIFRSPMRMVRTNK